MDYSLETNFRLNPFFRIKLEDPIVCDLFLEGTSLNLPHQEYLPLMGDLAEVITLEVAIDAVIERFKIDHEAAINIVFNLIEHRLLVEASEQFPEMSGVKHWVERGWLDALILHMKTRELDFTDDGASDPESLQNKEVSKLINAEGVPEIWKCYSGVHKVDLTDHKPIEISENIEDVLLRRRSNKPWRRGTLTLFELHTILYYASVETVRLREQTERLISDQPGVLLNSAFSAIELYVGIFDVQELVPGLYHWEPNTGYLALVREGLLRDQFKSMCVGQSRAGSGACTFVLTVNWQRYMFRYRHSKAYRTLLINVAELAHKIILLATSLQLSTFLTPAFEDIKADALFNFNGFDEGIVEAVGVG